MRRSLAILLTLAALLGVPSSAFAATGGPSPVEVAPGCHTSAQGIQDPVVAYGEDRHIEDDDLVGRVVVSPPSIDLEDPVHAGMSFTCVLTLRNRYDRRITLQLRPVGLRGSRSVLASAEFIEPDDEDAGATAARWLEPMPAEVTLDPRGVAEVPVRVRVPNDPPVGPAYASLHIVSKSSAPGPGETNIGVESIVSIPFLMSVGGDGAPELHLRTVRAAKLRWSRDPWTLRANLDNDGTLHATPRGRVRVRSLFGNTVHELPIAGTPLLPDGRQRVETTWDDVPWFGIYRYDVRVAPRHEPHTDRVTRATGWFVALPPWWILALAAAILLFAIFGAVARRRRERDWDEEDEDSISSADDLD